MRRPEAAATIGRLLAVLALIFGGAFARAAEFTNVAAPQFHASLDSAAKAALSDQSLVLLVFSGEWSTPARDLKAKVLESRELLEQGQSLHIVVSDVDAQPGLARDYGVQTVPAIFFLTGDLKIVSRATGYMETAELMLQLREARQRVQAGEWEGTASAGGLSALESRVASGRAGTNDLAVLIESLGHADPAEREQAVSLLLGLRDRAVPPLIEALTNSYLGIRVTAAEALHRLSPDKPMVDPWQSPEELRQEVAALQQWWKQTGRLPALAAAPAMDPSTATSISGALANLRGNDPLLRTRAMSTLVSFGPPALPMVRAAIQAAEKSGDQLSLSLLEDVRWAILVNDKLEERTSGVRSLLARGKGTDRQNAAMRLGRAGSEAIPALSELVNDNDPLVVENAVRSLAAIGGRESIPAMASLLNARDSNLRMSAAQALGHTKNRAAVSELLKVFGDPDEVVVCTALSAFEEINAERGYSAGNKTHAPEVIAALKSCLADPRWRVRATAVEIVGKIEARNLTADVKKLLDDSDGFVVKNALAASRQFGASPDSQRLLKIAERHPGLRGEVVQLLVGSDSVQAVTDLYTASAVDGRISMLEGISTSMARNSETGVWQPLLERASKESEAGLRRVAAGALAAQPPKVAAALVGPLLTDEDVETRIRAAEVILSIVSGERVVKANSQSTAYQMFIDDEISSSPKPKTNQPPVTAQDTARWHEVLARDPLTATNLLAAAALYVTGDTNAGLAGFAKVLEAADKDALSRFSQSAALPALLPRLPWPESKPVLERFCQSPGLFLRSLAYMKGAAAGISDFLLEPARFRAAVDPASMEDLSASLPVMLASTRGELSLTSESPKAQGVRLALLEATNAAWRAAAVFSMNGRQGADVAVFEKALSDSNVWVRLAAVPGFARLTRDRDALEKRLGPMLADPEKVVVRSVAMALLEEETRAASGMNGVEGVFQFQSIHAYGRSFGSSGGQRPLRVLDSKPAFLEQARKLLDQAEQEDIVFPAALLAQYGDFSGLDKLVAWFTTSDQKQEDFQTFVLTLVGLSKDPKYMPFVRQLSAAPQDQFGYQRLLQAIKGMTGPEARELRLEINRKIRETSS